MATYTATHWVNFDPGTGNNEGGPFGGGSYVFDDGNDGDWTDGEIISLTGTSATYEYLGTINVQGTDYPLLFNQGVGGKILLLTDNYADALWATNNISSVDVNGNGNTFTACFAAGTEIATPNGPVRVENLAIGDEIFNSAAQALTVKWIGRQTVSTRFGPAERLMPVRFAAGSLGDGLPHSDLTVTADHAMLVDGVLCNAGALVNGTTITQVPLAEMSDSFTVYHVETEAHEIIMANGAPAETFIDNVSRSVFDNFAEFDALYGDVPEMEELPLPRALTARQVPSSIKAKLNSRNAA